MELRIEPDLPIDEPPLETTINSDPSSGNCVVCGVELPYSGKGPRRKYCDDHRKQASPSSAAGRTTNVDTLINQIGDFYRHIGMAASFVPPTAMDGMIIAAEASKLAESWRPLIVKDRKIRELWQKITTGSGWGAVILAHGMIGMSIAANHGVHIPGLGPSPQPTPVRENEL